MKWFLVVVVCFCVVPVHSATKPASRPAIDTMPLAESVSKTKSLLVKAKADAKRRWEESPECKQLTEDLSIKRVARDTAKATGSLQEKLDAAKAYNDARLALEAATEKGLASGDDLAEAIKANRMAARELADAERRNIQIQEEADSRDPIKVAIKNKRIVIGMTMEQAIKAVGIRGQLERETEDLKLYCFTIFYSGDTVDQYVSGHNDFYVWFRDGKAVDVSVSTVDTSRPKPVPLPRR